MLHLGIVKKLKIDFCQKKRIQTNGHLIIKTLTDALEQAYAHIGRQPATGSPRYAHELNLPGLRFWPLARYPHLVFCVERPEHIDVWRVLHGQRDIPAWMHEPETL